MEKEGHAWTHFRCTHCGHLQLRYCNARLCNVCRGPLKKVGAPIKPHGATLTFTRKLSLPDYQNIEARASISVDVEHEKYPLKSLESALWTVSTAVLEHLRSQIEQIYRAGGLRQGDANIALKALGAEQADLIPEPPKIVAGYTEDELRQAEEKRQEITNDLDW